MNGSYRMIQLVRDYLSIYQLLILLITVIDGGFLSPTLLLDQVSYELYHGNVTFPHLGPKSPFVLADFV